MRTRNKLRICKEWLSKEGPFTYLAVEIFVYEEYDECDYVEYSYEVIYSGKEHMFDCDKGIHKWVPYYIGSVIYYVCKICHMHG